MQINIPNRSKGFDRPSVWLEFSALSKECGSINLGQGYPDWSPPQFLQKHAQASIIGSDFSTYARSAGELNLVKEIAYDYSDKLNHDIDFKNEVLVTVGATEALYLSIMSFIEKDDEVLIIGPAFDIYFGVLSMAEAKIKSVSLKSDLKIESANDLSLNWEDLKKKLSKKTKAIIFNSPHNPSGKVFNKKELIKLSEILKEFPDCLVISDEVYEHITYDNSPHISIGSLPGMYDRTLSIFSAGKTFSVTGWKIGWIIGPKALLKRLQIAQQWVVFSVATPLQEAIAGALKSARNSYLGFDNYYDWLRDYYLKKRDLLYLGLKDARLNPILPKGSFFILCDISHKKEVSKDTIKLIEKMDAEGKIHIDKNTLYLPDYNFCRSLSLNKKVTAIPMSAFQIDENKTNGPIWARFAFCKDDAVLQEAISNLLNN